MCESAESHLQKREDRIGIWETGRKKRVIFRGRAKFRFAKASGHRKSLVTTVFLHLQGQFCFVLLCRFESLSSSGRHIQRKRHFGSQETCNRTFVSHAHSIEATELISASSTGSLHRFIQNMRSLRSMDHDLRERDLDAVLIQRKLQLTVHDAARLIDIGLVHLRDHFQVHGRIIQLFHAQI